MFATCGQFHSLKTHPLFKSHRWQVVGYPDLSQFDSRVPLKLCVGSV